MVATPPVPITVSRVEPLELTFRVPPSSTLISPETTPPLTTSNVPPLSTTKALVGSVGVDIVTVDVVPDIVMVGTAVLLNSVDVSVSN
jgi:hypothetical protein